MSRDRRKTAQMVERSMSRRGIKGFMIEAVILDIMEGDDINDNRKLDELVKKIKEKGKPSSKSNYQLVMEASAYWDNWLDEQEMKPVKTPKKKKSVKKKRPRSIIKKGLYKK